MKNSKKTAEFLEQLEKDILAGKTFPTPKQETKLQSDYTYSRAALYRATAGHGVLPTNNGLEKKRFT